MNDTLKVASRIGAELGAAKAENEAMRILLRESYSELLVMKTEVGFRGKTLELIDRIDAFLSRQPEPTDTYTAVDMATAAAQGFRDGQAAVEPAPAQDEREAYSSTLTQGELNLVRTVLSGTVTDELVSRVTSALAARPAQTEQQPVAFIDPSDLERFTGAKMQAMTCTIYASGSGLAALHAAPIAQTAPQHSDDAAVDRFAAAMKAKLAAARAKGRGGWDDPNVCSVEFLAQLLVEHLGKGNTGTFEDVANFAMMLHQRGAEPKVLADAAPIVQTAPQGKFRLGDLVKKSSGSEWVGRVVGWYSTEQTKEGYAVESSAHRNSVQIYPVTALEAVE